ncbi:MAG TPA: hypothetical protein VIR27_20260 [Mycobacteriales bacterium]|jgi:hypothetical protein
MTGTPPWEPVTDEERRRSEQAIEQLKRDLAATRDQPRPPVTSPGKFTEPLGMDAQGNPQPPLTPEEAAHNEWVRRRGAAARGQDDTGQDRPGRGR